MSLREEMHSLVEQIASTSDTRRVGLLSLQRGVTSQQEEGHRFFHELHLARSVMAQGLRTDLGKVRSGLAQEETQRGSRVQGWLGDVAGARQGMARQMYAALSREHAGLARAESERGSRFQRWLGEIAGDRSAAGIEWRRLAALRGERAGISKASAGADGSSHARDRVFQHLASHPDGLRLTEIEREFGMSRFESARAMKELVKSGKAEKRDLLYFAV